MIQKKLTTNKEDYDDTLWINEELTIKFPKPHNKKPFHNQKPLLITRNKQ